MKNTNNKRGFTLIESIIALGIFSIVSIVCLQMYFMEIKKVKILNEKQIVEELAFSMKEKILVELEKVEETEGNFEEPFSDYRWEIKLSDLSFLDTENNIEIVPYILKVTGGNENAVIFLPEAEVKK